MEGVRGPSSAEAAMCQWVSRSVGQWVMRQMGRHNMMTNPVSESTKNEGRYASITPISFYLFFPPSTSLNM